MYTWTPEERKTWLARVRELIASRFDVSELRSLCVDLGIDYDDVPGSSKADKTRELAPYCERREKLSELINTCRELRPPKVDWPDPPPESKEAHSPDTDSDKDKPAPGPGTPSEPTPPRPSTTETRDPESRKRRCFPGWLIAIVGIVAVGLGVALGYLFLPRIIGPTCPGCAGFVIGRGYGCPANMEAVGSGASDRSCRDTFMLPSPTTTTQIRIDMTQRALKEFGYSLYEVEAYGPDDPTKNLLKDGNVAVSSTEEDRYVASNAADGDKTSRWASEKGRDPQWLEITLPQPARVNRIELRWEQAYATEYCVIVKPAQ